MGKGKVTQRKEAVREDKPKPWDLSLITALTLALLVSVYHYKHISSLFENDRFFSHLSTLEREMTFRTEAGFYYMFFKTIANAPSFSEGLHEIVNDNGTEYPSTINTLSRFNVYPEVIIGGSFRVFNYLCEMTGYQAKSCYNINRGYGQEPVRSCIGLGDETYYYLTCVFVLGGVQMGILFMLCRHVSDSIMGGVLGVSCFLFNHGECTRVQWTPPLRENFSFPFLLLQILLVSRSLQKAELQRGWLVIATVLFVLPWQFSQFVLLTQTLSLFFCAVVGVIDKVKVERVLDAVFVGYVIGTVLQFGNTMLLSSLYVSAYLGVKLALRVHYERSKVIEFCIRCAVFLTLFIAYKYLSGLILNLQDDAHIFNILKAKFTEFKDFHTLLYVCAKEFDYIELSTFYKLVLTLLLPVGLVTITRLVYNFTLCQPSPTYSHLAYHLVQFLCFLTMAILLMRLKLFMTPYLCVLASLLASDFILPQTNTSRAVIVTLLLGAMSIQGVQNIQAQRNIMGEYNNPDQEELFTWIEKSVDKQGVFAGSMPLMANLRLSTGRSIVNHPHYEDVGLRERTKKVYQVFSRKPGAEVHATLSSLSVQYAVLDVNWCKPTRPKAGCAIPEVWDVEDVENRDKPTFCSQVAYLDKLFKIVFSNRTYRVIKLL